jgi:hypothetical protein
VCLVLLHCCLQLLLLLSCYANIAKHTQPSAPAFKCLQAKLVIRAAAKLAPSPVLNSVAAFLQAGLQTAASSNSAATAASSSESGQTPQQHRTLQKQLQQGHMALEADVILLESVLPSLCDASVVTTAAGLTEGLAALLQQLMAQRYREPLLVTLVSCFGCHIKCQWSVCMICNALVCVASGCLCSDALCLLWRSCTSCLHQAKAIQHVSLARGSGTNKPSTVISQL